MADFNPQYRQELAKKRMLEKNSRVFGGYRNEDKYNQLSKYSEPYLQEKKQDIIRKGEELQREREGGDDYDPGRRNALNQSRARSRMARAKKHGRHGQGSL